MLGRSQSEIVATREMLVATLRGDHAPADRPWELLTFFLPVHTVPGRAAPGCVPLQFDAPDDALGARAREGTCKLRRMVRGWHARFPPITLHTSKDGGYLRQYDPWYSTKHDGLSRGRATP